MQRYLFLMTVLAGCQGVVVAPRNTSLGCIAEYQACTGYTDDEVDPCCDGLYCAVLSSYYAQCKQAIAAPTSRPTAATPAARPTTQPTPATLGAPSRRPTSAPATLTDSPTTAWNSADDDGSASYSCGEPLEAQTGVVMELFSAWKDTYLVTRGSGFCVQRPTDGNDCVSEGTGYGMLLAAQLGDQATFDGLWAFAQEHADDNGLMNWQISSSNNNQGTGSATDADIDMALGLAIATSVWGDEYLDDAKAQINRILEHEVDSSFMLLPGDSWENVDPMPTNPSYFSPGHFRVFNQLTGDSAWLSVIDSGYALLNDCASYNSNTGLVPDWTYDNGGCTPGSSIVSDTDGGQDYFYDACRTPWRLSLDMAWTCATPAAAHVSKFKSFFEGFGPNGMSTGFTLTGTPLSNSGSTNGCFVSTASTVMVAGSADNNTRSSWQSATVNFWKGNNYYCDTLVLLAVTFNAGMMPMPDVSRR